MPTYGFIEKFSGKGEDFDTYLERLDFYFKANDLGEIVLTSSNADTVNARREKRKSILLSVIGADTYSLLRTLCAPTRPSEKTYKEITDLLTAHFSPKPSEVVSRYKFHTRIRQPGESVSSFMSELRKLADHCNFNNYLTDMLRDRLVCGIADERVQRLLLTEKELTLEKAYQVCIAEETASKDSSILKGEHVNKVNVQRKHFHTKQTPPKVKPNHTPKRYCYRCGEESHVANRCKYINTPCNYCKKIGHLAKVCLKKKAKSEANAIGDEPSDNDDCAEEIPVSSIQEEYVYHTTSTVQPPITVPVLLEDNATPVDFQIDTGSGVSIMNKSQFLQFCGEKALQPAHIKLTAYSGDRIEVLGKTDVNVQIGNQSATLPLIVVDGNGVPLLGRQWLFAIQLPWHQILSSSVNNIQDADVLVSEFADLFRNAPGKITDSFARFEVRADVTPVFCKARTVPFAMKKRIQEKLDQLENDGIIRKVQNSEWAAPLVPVIKPSGELRLCGDYKMTVNKVINLDTYPLPLIDELFANLSGGVSFSKLDLSQAYHQLPLDETSRKYTTVNTPNGLYEYLRLPYGINAAVGIFQRTIENILKGLKGVCVYLDDILVTGKTTTEHVENLHAVLLRLQENGITLKREKCKFFLPEVEYLGFNVSKDGLKPTKDKVEAIKEAEAPKSLSELRSFIGIVNYYSRFLPNLADKMAPLYALLQKTQKWKWTVRQQSAFDKIKQELSDKALLAHYNPAEELVLTCDASPFGIGAVLQQRSPDGNVRPIAFVSRTLSQSEKNYAQIEREGLSIVFGAEKFRHYLLGRQFTLETDHKPLLTLFAENKGIPEMASARIKRWAMKLSAFQYKIQYITSKENACADFLSRSPLPGTGKEQNDQVLSIEDENLPITARAIAAETARDPVLVKVKQLTLSGWPQYMNDDEIQPYFQRRTELSVEQDCVMWGTRVVIPTSLRPSLLLDLHSDHMGIVRMKAMARQYLWWPRLNAEIEEIARKCESCREQDPMPPARTTAASWDWPAGPWRRLHLDFAGPFLDRMFLVVVDAHSKWLEVFPMKTATSETTIRELRRLFSQFGLPEHIVTDNGSQFTSVQFKNFLIKNNIRHTCSAPGHPATNGLAERYVGYFKHQLKKMKDINISVEEKLARFLLSYRTTPHPSTNEAPCVVLMKKQLRTRLSAVQPSLQLRKEAEVLEKNFHSQKYIVGQPVYALNLRPGPRWLPGIIVDVLNRNYSVQIDGMVIKRHEEQLRPRSVAVQKNIAPLNPLEGLNPTPPVIAVPTSDSVPPETPVVESLPSSPPRLPSVPTSTPSSPAPPERNSPLQLRRNPRRNVEKPIRYRVDL